MRYRLPMLAENAEKNLWVGWGSPPPGPETAGTAVAFNRFGKGQCVYLGVPIFRAMQWRAYWIQKLVPAMVRQLVPHPVAELQTEPTSEFVHGTFFHDVQRRLILVQVLDAAELATKGERRATPDIEISLDMARHAVREATVMWPQAKDLEVQRLGGRYLIRITKPERYTAIYLRLV